MNDIFIEQLVKKKRTTRDRVIFVVTIILVILIPATITLLAVRDIIMHYFVIFGLFFFLMGIWFIWFTRSHQNVEFEYQMVQDILVVSKIIAKRKRKELLRLDTHNIEQLAKGDEPEMNKIKLVKVTDAAVDSSDDKNTYYAIYSHAGGGRRALFFNPNEKVLGAMKPYLKKDIVLKLFYNRG
ncbi:MAG: hypothetical protein K6F88_04790 [Ruminococcus sp.]|nr:hypothetical protein [Ruminococcus sp.]